MQCTWIEKRENEKTWLANTVLLSCQHTTIDVRDYIRERFERGRVLVLVSVVVVVPSPPPPTADEDSVVIAISSTSGCKACLTPLLPVVVEPLTTFSFVLVLVMWEVVADVVAVLSLLIIPSFLFSNDDDDDDDDDDDVSVFVSTIIGCCCCCSLPPSIQTGAVPLFVVIAFRPVIVSAECPVDSWSPPFDKNDEDDDDDDDKNFWDVPLLFDSMLFMLLLALLLTLCAACTAATAAWYKTSKEKESVVGFD